MKVRFRAEAASDAASAREWYDHQRVGLGGEFLLALEQLIDVISDLPEAFPLATPDHHRAVLRRFPYAIYYRIDRGLVDVVACLHMRRSSNVLHLGGDPDSINLSG